MLKQNISAPCANIVNTRFKIFKDMADNMLFFLVQWEDRYLSVLHHKDIVNPKKPMTEYKEGEIVQALFKSKTYNAVISEIHPNKKFLQQQAKLPPKYSYHVQANENSPEGAGIFVSSSTELSSVELCSPPSTELQRKENEREKAGPEGAENMMSSAELSSPSISPQRKEKDMEKAGTCKTEQAGVIRCDVQEARSGGWEEECRSLRRKLRRIEDRITALEKVKVVEDPELLAVDHTDDAQEVLVTLARTIFTDEELINHSRTGKMTNKCKGSPRPPLQPSKLEKLERLVRKKTGVSREIFIKKLENLQKVMRRKHLTM